MSMKVGEPLDGKGKVKPLVDTRYTGDITAAFVVEMEDGFYTFMADTGFRCDSFGEAVSQAERRSAQ